jgi:hypothetical protein
LSSLETDGVLKRHEVFLEMTAEEVIAESEAICRFSGECRGGMARWR